MSVDPSERRAGTPAKLQNSGLLAWHWLMLALVIMVGASALAWLQPGTLPAANGAQPTSSLWQRFTQPIESNPHMGLVSTRATLELLHLMPDGRRAWAAGYGNALRTVDGGQTWTSAPAELTNPDELIRDITFPNGGERGFAGTSSGKLLVSNDGGDSWSTVPQFASNQKAEDIEQITFSADGTFGIAKVGVDLLTTSDRGTRWQRRKGPDSSHIVGDYFIQVKAEPAPRGAWMVSYLGLIVRTVDGGATWTEREDLESLQLTSLSFSPDGKHMWAASRKGVAHSSDGGSSWTMQHSSTVEMQDITFHRDGQRGWAVGAEGQGILTNDGGKTWQSMDTASAQDLHRIAFDQDGMTGVATGSKGTLLVSRNGGKSWRTASVPAVPQSRLAIAPDLSHAAVATALGIRSSRDGGRTWTINTPAALGKVHAVTFSADGKYGWATSDQGVIGTDNGGLSWKAQTVSSTPLSDVFFLPNNRHGWAIGENAAKRTSDGGQTWSDAPALAERKFDRLFFSTEKTGWALGKGAIWSTSDGGDHWTARTDQSEARLNDIAFDDSGKLGYAVGYGASFYFTDNAGESWTPRYCIQGCNFTSVAVSGDGMRVWMAGNDGAIMRTSDGGARWSAPAATTSEDLVGIRFSTDGNRGLAIGEDGAVIRSDDGGASWAPAQTWWRVPAPWYWLIMLLAALPVWLAWKLRPAARVRESMADVGTSDAAISQAADDRLDFSGLARGISRFLRNPATGAPLTLAISGDWGSGKSSLMQLVCSDLRRFDHFPVWFNAWHHQKEELLFAALLGAIRTQAVPPLTTLAGVGFRLRLLWLRSRKHFGLLLLLVAGGSALLTINLPFFLEPNLAKIVASIEALARLAQSIAIPLATLLAAGLALATAVKPFKVNPALLLTTLRDNMSIKNAAAQNDFRDQFAQQFGELTAALPQRLVIVIDDLDRCRPSAVLDVMEAVNYLTSSGECVVIFGMARERVLASLGLAFKDIAAELVMMDAVGTAGDTAPDPAVSRRRSYAADYLQKLINIEISVPSGGDGSLHKLLATTGPAQAGVATRTAAALWKFAPVAAVGVAIIAGLCLARWIPGPEQGGIGRASAPAIAATAAEPATRASPAPGTAAPAVARPQQRRLPQAEAVRPAQQGTLLMLFTWLGLALAPALVTGAIVMLRLLRKTANETRDSERFTRALEIWTPVVAAKRYTPRSIKRFGNRVRYLAMLQQGEQNDDTQLDILKRHVKALIRRQPAELTSVRRDALAEHQLIALGAIHELCGVNWTHAMATNQWNDPAVRIVEKAIAAHREEFETDWPPSPAEISVFERLLSGVRLAGDPLVLQPSQARRAQRKG